MKRYKLLMAVIFATYLCLAVLVYVDSSAADLDSEHLEYKVEINRVLTELKSELKDTASGVDVVNGQNILESIDLSEYQYIKRVAFLPAKDIQDVQKLNIFYANHNGVHSYINPLISGDELRGYVRFDYRQEGSSLKMLWIMELILAAAFIVIAVIITYVNYKILKPFNSLSDMPYELAKGHLKGEVYESKSRFFGKFVWGISMLRDELSAARSRELKLTKDKKMLLLSLSHDIKIPLSTIKLYAKALKEDMYDTKEEIINAAERIEVHASEIDDFVREIISASSEEIISIQVNNSEFYLKDYVDKLVGTYKAKCETMMTTLEIGHFQNRLLKGDIERAFEVVENLMENAFKYGDGKRIAIEFYEEDCFQIVKVYNSGETVAQEEIIHLFDSFYRGSNTSGKEGNGLGLYICKQIMLKMSGDIFVQRESGGMSFCLVFEM